MTCEPAVRNRIDRRRERTRNALLGAAQRFLAEGRSAVGIQEIADAADVGFGSFCNHFESKEQLFDILRMFGVNHRTAQRLSSGPLPPQAELGL